MQVVRASIQGRYDELLLPDPSVLLLSNIRWGRFEEIFTPAYWASQVWMRAGYSAPQSHRLGTNLQEEVAACLLGGYGVPAEVGLAAFDAVRHAGLLEQPDATEKDFEQVLMKPVLVNGRYIHYRFARQRSRYLGHAMAQVHAGLPQVNSGAELREWLLNLPGVGLKTASWIARNWLDCDDVAIIDIHLYRAGLLAGFFKEADRVDKHYRKMESDFLAFARALGVRPSVLDAVIWFDMKSAGHLAHELFHERTQVVSRPRGNHRHQRHRHQTTKK